MATVQETLAWAWHHFQAGDFAQAETRYREALEAEPENATAWCLLGIVRRNLGRLDEAAACYREALRLKPGFLEALNNLGNVLVVQGQSAEALASFEEVLRQRPDHAQAHNNLGVALRNLGRLDEAVTHYREALRLRPDYADAHNNLGDALRSQDQVDEALACYQQALRHNPGHVEALNNLGVALTRLGRPAEAMPHLRRALELRPAYADAQNNLANAFLEQKQYDDAVAAYREALRLKPDFPEAYANLGIALAAQGKLDDAAAAYEHALRLRPHYPEALTNLGNVRQEQGRLDEALVLYDQSLREKPDHVEAHDNRGQALLARGDLAGALDGFGQALSVRPDYAEAHMGRALALLLQGDYARGWEEYEWRWRTKGNALPAFTQPQWDGSPLTGKTVLLVAEQGLGDTVFFARYAQLVKERGGTVVFQCQKPLARILTTCPGIDRLVPQGEELPAFDVWAPVASLPRLCRTTGVTVPAPIPYLAAEPNRVEHWRRELGPPRGYRVGIAWQGNPSFPADRRRSIPLAAFAPLAAVPGVQLYSLQKGPGVEQLDALGGAFPVVDLGRRLDEIAGPFVDTLAVLKVLDLVVACDTVVGHLAGALGVPVWLALATSPHWPWRSEGDASPWYPSARLFRQQRSGDWAGVFARIADELRGLSRPDRQVGPIQLTVGPGELMDRIAALEVHRGRLVDPGAAKEVDRELAALRALRDASLAASDELVVLGSELKAAHKTLGECRDGLARCEERNDFGPRFVQLSRTAHRARATRTAVMRRVDELFGVSGKGRPPDL